MAGYIRSIHDGPRLRFYMSGISFSHQKPGSPIISAMLERIFVVLSNLPGLKKKLWRTLYGSLARWYNASDWTFMNYGYISEPDPLVLEPKDERNRNWIHLYYHVAGAVDLKGLEILEVGSGRGGGASFIKRYLHPE